MSALNNQIQPQLSAEQVIDNHISAQTMSEITGYNIQFFPRLMRSGKLDGVKIGQV